MDCLKSYAKKYLKEYKHIAKLFEKYDKIAIFRHVVPDFDALGSQLGLYTYLKNKYPLKDIKVVGEESKSFNDGLFRPMDIVDDSWFEETFLAVILDVTQDERISDGRYKKASEIIKFDHHPGVEDYATVNITDSSVSATSEMVCSCLYYLENYKNIGAEAARYFYISIVGDSGRFLFSSTGKHTFAIAEALINEGIDLVEIYKSMYEKDKQSLEITKFILNRYKLSPHGVAYYWLTEEDQIAIKLDKNGGKEYVNTFSNLRGIEIWVSASEDTEKHCYWCSLRSKGICINKVAQKYNGGGHPQASGCHLDSLDQLEDLIKDLDDLIVEANNKK